MSDTKIEATCWHTEDDHYHTHNPADVGDGGCLCSAPDCHECQPKKPEAK